MSFNLHHNLLVVRYVPAIDNEDVLEPKIVFGWHICPKAVYNSSFRSIFSITASTTKSTSCNASISVVKTILPIDFSASSADIFSFSTSFSTDFRIRSRLCCLFFHMIVLLWKFHETIRFDHINNRMHIKQQQTEMMLLKIALSELNWL